MSDRDQQTAEQIAAKYVAGGKHQHLTEDIRSALHEVRAEETRRALAALDSLRIYGVWVRRDPHDPAERKQNE